MTIIASHIKWIMLVSGALTCTMVFAVIAPQAALTNTFGETLSGPLAEIVVRNWGALITLIGLMLIYAAFHPAHRKLVAVVAATSKLIWASLVLLYGSQFLSKAAFAVGFDLTVAVLLLIFVFAPGADDAAR